MSRFTRRSCWLTAALGSIVAAALVGAPTAPAKPQCTDLTPTTTMCRTPGHVRISTSSPARPSGPQYGWPLGGVVIGFL
ncbi:hypothetical protein [Mycolicibacterium thermoresistibile]|jgi:hypothetical protein|uniref:hypothetical protein n=1 Tax=Mycolicibacterium thermoresistibile TaxID=1797 RepID=UPI0007EB44EC|nr:hypothetical protein [Mycolicibacterium thermoresistibile]